MIKILFMKHKNASLFFLTLVSVAITSCVVPGHPAGLAVSTVSVDYSTNSSLPSNYVGDAYFYEGRYYSGGRYENGRFHDHGRAYSNRYYYNGRYYYGGRHDHYNGHTQRTVYRRY